MNKNTSVRLKHMHRSNHLRMTAEIKFSVNFGDKKKSHLFLLLEGSYC